jgi:hypothetical protein
MNNHTKVIPLAFIDHISDATTTHETQDPKQSTILAQHSYGTTISAQDAK